MPKVRLDDFRGDISMVVEVTEEELKILSNGKSEVDGSIMKGKAAELRDELFERDDINQDVDLTIYLP